MPELSLAEWRDFYVMIGTASGAIVGATFVVATLASGLKEKASFGMRGFITPTTVHLGSVLVGSAILAIPTLTKLSLAVILGVGGLAGVIYSLVVAARIWRMKLDRDDRVFYVVLPVVAYATMGMAAFATVGATPENALEFLALSLIALLIIGIRNAWDMAIFMITRDSGP